MAKQTVPPIYLQIIPIIEKLQKLGFPQVANIDAMLALAKDLQKFSPKLHIVHQHSIENINLVLQKIKARLQQEKTIPIRMYTTLNARLVVFKENLISSD